MGRRVQKTVYAYAASTFSIQSTHRYTYNGWNLVKETTIPDSGSAVDKFYVWGLDLSQSLQGAGGVGGLLAVVDGSLTYQYFCDANGNVGQVVNAGDGSVAAHYEYDPFGNMVTQTGDYADGNPYRFSTKYQDAETTLYYYGYRYYSTELGRWINRDPLGEEGGVNVYCFVYNNGALYVDPYGLKTIPQISGELKERSADLARLYSAAQRNSLANGDPAGYLVNSINAITYGIAALLLPANDEEFFVALVTADMGPVIVSAAKYAGLSAKILYSKVYKKCGTDLVEVSDDVARNVIKELEERVASKNSGTETVQRWMSKAELKATEKTSLMRGGRDGTHYVTDSANSNALRARQRSALPQTPEVKVTMEVPKGKFSSPSKVEPAFNMPGGGMERTATGNIPVKIIKVQ